MDSYIREAVGLATARPFFPGPFEDRSCSFTHLTGRRFPFLRRVEWDGGAVGAPRVRKPRERHIGSLVLHHSFPPCRL